MPLSMRFARKSVPICGVTAISTEGARGQKLALIDFGSVVVHVFKPETRDFYRLETLWGDAPEVDMGLDDADANAEANEKSL